MQCFENVHSSRLTNCVVGQNAMVGTNCNLTNVFIGFKHRVANKTKLKDPGKILGDAREEMEMDLSVETAETDYSASD